MVNEYKEPLQLNVKYELSNEFASKVNAEPGCKVEKVIELISCKMLQYWIDCPKEKEKKITEYAFMTWIKNPVFQKYYGDSKAFEEISENYIQKQSELHLIMHPPIIKFRGSGTTDGKDYYGYFTGDDNGKACIILKGGAWREVKPESVVQMICYDKHKNEVYPGDEAKYFSQQGLVTPFRYELTSGEFIPCWIVGDSALLIDANMICKDLELIEEL